MIIIERQVKKVLPGKWQALHELDKKYDLVERGLGFPPKKRYQCYLGGDTNTVIVERQWESMAAMEAAYEKAFMNPEIQALGVESESIIGTPVIEIYAPLP